MDITRLAIEKSRITIVVLLAIIAGGIFVFQKMPQDEDPGFTIRTAFVATYLPGASPERMEKLVTEAIEKKVREIPELDNVTSESRTGASIIYVNIKESYKDMRPVWDNLRRKIESIKPQLPEGIYGPFVNDEFGDVYGIVITVTGDGYSMKELKKTAEEVRDEILRVPDVAKVEIYGAPEERIYLDFDSAKIARLGLTTFQLNQLLEAQNIIIPGGNISQERERIVLEPTGNFENIDELKKTVINIPALKDVLYLGDIVNIYRGFAEPPAAIVTSSGKPAIGIGVSMRKGGNVITLSKNFEKTFARLKQAYPIGIEFEKAAYQPERVAHKVNSFIRNLIEAIALVIGVMLISLGFRTGFLVSALIPATIIMTLLLMYFFNIGIDQVSLGAMLIALGMLVDNAIVISEYMMVQMAEGKKVLDAAVSSCRELRKPLLTSMLAISCAFLPIYLAESITGEYTASLFKVVAITLLSSWVLAITLTPLLCVNFLKVHKHKGDIYDSKFYKAYRKLILLALKNKAAFLGIILVLFAISIYGLGFVPKIFFPQSDDSIVTAEIELPYGSTIDYTQKTVKVIEDHLDKKWKINKERKTGIVNWASFIGTGAPRYIIVISPEPPRENYAYMIINTTDLKILPDIIKDVESFTRENLPDAKIKIQSVEMGPPVKNPVEYRISGKESEKIFKIADDVKSKLRTVKGVKNIGDDWGSRTKKVLVKIDQPRARRAGVTSKDIAVSLQTMLAGIRITNYREDDKLIPVVLRSSASERDNIEKLETLNVFSQMTGRAVPLSQIADLEVVFEPSKVLRRDGFRTVTVSAQLEAGFTADMINSQMEPWLDTEKENWGFGYRYLTAGTSYESERSNKAIVDKLPIAIIFILLMFVFQFNSYRRTFIILSVVPLGIIGVVAGLLLNHSYFGFMTLLGIVSLSGIVINNANVLLDRIRVEIDENGRPAADAIIEAAQRRLRPIFLTTACTVGGLIPLWFGGGPMFEPMAIAIIFGLSFATVLTLGVVPVMYAILYRVKYR